MKAVSKRIRNMCLVGWGTFEVAWMLSPHRSSSPLIPWTRFGANPINLNQHYDVAQLLPKVVFGTLQIETKTPPTRTLDLIKNVWRNNIKPDRTFVVIKRFWRKIQFWSRCLVWSTISVENIPSRYNKLSGVWDTSKWNRKTTNQDTLLDQKRLKKQHQTRQNTRYDQEILNRNHSAWFGQQNLRKYIFKVQQTNRNLWFDQKCFSTKPISVYNLISRRLVRRWFRDQTS